MIWNSVSTMLGSDWLISNKLEKRCRFKEIKYNDLTNRTIVALIAQWCSMQRLIKGQEVE